jgi:hypothetical protein
LIDGFALTGKVTFDYDVAVIYDVTVNGNEDDHLTYTHDLATDMYTIEGMFDGEPVTTPRLLY